MKRAAIAAAVALCCAACATPGRERLEQGQRALAEARICCRSLAEAARQPLPAARTAVDIGPGAQAFAFDGAKSFFVFFELPRFDKPYAIAIASLPVGPLNDQALLVPRVALYDADFRATRRFDEASLRRRGPVLERVVFVNEKDAGERYLAIFASDAADATEYAYSTVTTHVIPAGNVFVSINAGADGKATLRAAPIGTIVVEIEGASPPGASALDRSRLRAD